MHFILMELSYKDPALQAFKSMPEIHFKQNQWPAGGL